MDGLTKVGLSINRWHSFIPKRLINISIIAVVSIAASIKGCKRQLSQCKIVDGAVKLSNLCYDVA